MRIRPFIFTWTGQDPAPTIQAWEAILGPVTVINSDEPRDGWINLGPDAHFTEQWLKAIELFDGDVLFHCQADATCDHWPRVVERALELYARYQWDNFAPFVDYTGHRKTNEQLEAGVYRVPVNDCTCWMLHARLIERYRALDIDWRANRFGWGHDKVMGALAEMAIRDHTLKVLHPRRTGYSQKAARRQMKKMLTLLPSEVRAKIRVTVPRR
jgi:hypothetical protein